MNKNAKSVVINGNISIPWCDKAPSLFLDRTTLIYGGSNTGKTTIIEDLMMIVKPYIPTILVIAPKSTAERFYRTKVPSICIKDVSYINKERLEKIWKRQVDSTEVYDVANDLKNLENLFNKCNDDVSTLLKNAMIQRSYNNILDIEKDSKKDEGEKSALKNNIKNILDDNLIKLYKKIISNNKESLLRHDLSRIEKIVLKFLYFNPKMLIIFDDCSEYFPVWMKLFGKDNNIFLSMFFKNRWNHLTLKIACHDEKLLSTELRKNVHVSIFTSSQALMSSVNKAQSGFSSGEKKNASLIAEKVFGDDGDNIKKHRKVCYLKDANPNFQYMIADRHGSFTIGCNALNKLSDRIPSNSTNTLNNNNLL